MQINSIQMTEDVKPKTDKKISVLFIRFTVLCLFVYCMHLWFYIFCFYVYTIRGYGKQRACTSDVKHDFILVLITLQAKCNEPSISDINSGRDKVLMRHNEIFIMALGVCENIFEWKTASG